MFEGGARTMLAAGKTVTVPVTITNTGMLASGGDRYPLYRNLSFRHKRVKRALLRAYHVTADDSLSSP
jgi:hypothetical protein